MFFRYGRHQTETVQKSQVYFKSQIAAGSLSYVTRSLRMDWQKRKRKGKETLVLENLESIFIE